jgi:hypothetical protein
MAMMAITTKSSIRVKPFGDECLKVEKVMS